MQQHLILEEIVSRLQATLSIVLFYQLLPILPRFALLEVQAILRHRCAGSDIKALWGFASHRMADWSRSAQHETELRCRRNREHGRFWSQQLTQDAKCRSYVYHDPAFGRQDMSPFL